MLKKILAFILCFCMLIPARIVEVKASEYEIKYLPIRRLNDDNRMTCKVVTDRKNVYINIDDLVQVADFDKKVIDSSDGKIILKRKGENQKKCSQDITIFPKLKKISSMQYGEKEFEGYIEGEGNVFLDIVQIFNYLRVKAEIIDGELLINIPVYTLLDFMAYDYPSILADSVSQLDLLNPKESIGSSGFYDALSLACNNFDFRLLIPVWGADKLKDEQYVKAIQTLNEEDEVFYDKNTNQYLKKELYNRGFTGVLASGKDLVNVLSIGGKTIETAEEIMNDLESVPAEKIRKYLELVNWNGKEYDASIELRAWNKYASKLSDAISLAEIAVSSYETYSRAENWNKECLEDLEVLKNLDETNYANHKGYIKRIKKVAESCYQESINKDKTTTEYTLEKIATLMLEKILTETSVYGRITDYFILAINTGTSVAKCFGNIADEMDKAELSYMVTCLINVAVASRIDAEIEHDALNLKNVNSGEAQNFRKSMRTAIKSNLRCWSYIYYLNSDGKWEESDRGKEVKDKINKMYTYLTLLKETEQYDYALDEYDLITYNPKKIIEILSDNNDTLRDLIGEWTIDEKYTMEYNNKSMKKIYGSLYYMAGRWSQMVFREDGTFEYGVTEYYGKGNFKVENEIIKVNLAEGDPNTGELELYMETEDISRIAFDQFGDGTKIFWKRVDASENNTENTPNTESVLKEGVYRYSDGDFRAELQVCTEGDKKQCYWGEWYNYGASASVEDFVFTWEDGKAEYEVQGRRSGETLSVKLDIQGETVAITIKNQDGVLYYGAGMQQEGKEFQAEYSYVGTGT